MCGSVISAEERKQLHEVLDRLIDDLPLGLEAAERVEELVRDRLRDLGAQTMQSWADGADRNTLDTACPGCGEPMRHRGNQSLTVESLAGCVRFRRPRRRCERCGVEVYLHDRHLRFGEHGVSWSLARWIVSRTADVPYDSVRAQLEEDYRIALSKQTLEAIVHDAGRLVLPQEDARREAFFAQSPREQAQNLPESACRPALLAIYADAAKLHSEGEWRDIRVGRVRALDETDRPLEEKTFARFLSVEEFGRKLWLDAQQAGYQGAQQRVFLGDGAHWIWEIAAMQFPEAVPILDWFHLSENVHECAKGVFGEGTDEARAWAGTRLEELSEGRAAQSQAEIAKLRKTLRAKSKREALRKLTVYLKNNVHRIDYPKYRQAGLPIGSGPIESTCKKLVGQRCKLAGMRSWTDHGVQTVLRFRSAKHDGEFDNLWNTRVRQAA